MLRGAIVLLVVGCGSPPVGEDRSSGGEAIVLTRVREDLVCTEQVPSGERECVARGCRWQAPLFCSGVQVPDEVIERFGSDRSRPCTCVCETDVIDCMSRP